MRPEVLFWALTFPMDSKLMEFVLKNPGGCVPAIRC